MTTVPPYTEDQSLSSSSSHSNSKLFDQLRYLMILRVVIITTFMLVALPLLRKTETEHILWFIVGLIVFLYFLTIIYSLLLYKIKNLSAFAYFQITGDIIFETGLIYISGPIYSPLVFLYIISIISAGILLSTYGAYISASLSCISYGILAALSQNNIIPFLNIFGDIETHYSTGDLLYKLFVNFCSFYLVAYLSNHLIKGLRKAGEELDTKQENLLRLEKLNENILRSIDSGLVSVNLSGHIVTFNQAAEKITGYQEHEMIGKEVQRIFPINELMGNNPQGSLAERPVRSERLFTTKFKSDIFLGYSFSNLFDEFGQNTGYILIFQDLTEFKKLEYAKKRAEKMAILGELAARMAHEIRNPLTSMKGSIEIISKEQTLQSSHKKLLDIILRESDRLNRLITNFLQYAHPRKMLTQRFSLSNLVEEVVFLLRNHPKMNDRISIETELPEEEIYVQGDMFQIKQVLLNLCLNSIDAIASEGRLAITLDEMIREDQSHFLKSDILKTLDLTKYIALLVKDNGQGIPSEYREHIFTPFFSTKEMGTGLGLAIAYRIIEDHGGFIDYQSDDDIGTTFAVFLPKNGLGEREEN